MDARSLAVLEYPKIIEILKSYCVSDGAKEKAAALAPMTAAIQVNRALDATEESLEMMLRNGRPPLAEIAGVEEYVGRAAIGSILTPGELMAVGRMLRVARDMIAYYHNDTQIETLGIIGGHFDALDPIEPLEKDISRKILSETEIADNASRELSRIRREITIKNGRITEKLNSLIASPSNEKYLQDKLVTIRGNRYVVPVKQEYRAQVPGIVLDRSASGATLFIEPMSVVELNNDLKVLASEEEKEIARILREMTEQVALYKDEISYDYDMLTELDFLFAKGKYGLDLGGAKVAVADDGAIAFLRARHPLLDKETAVASDIVFSEDVSTMVITGPNTGGKTVTLKTIGLTNLMVQSGLYVAVKEQSTTRPFGQIFADIGDEQSIEQSLSTFSSHMTNIVEILKQANDQSLVLFDELGAGTDPTEGAALAISILDNLHARGVVSVSTTHYSELKEYGLVTPGVVNASVEFDVATLRPTYRLLIGVPGKSNAFEISGRLGLGDEIIDNARKLIRSETIRFEETLMAIEEKRKKTEEAHDEMRRLQDEITALKVKTQWEAAKLEAENNEILEIARLEAADIVTKARAETEAIYKDIRRIQEATGAAVGDNRELEALRKRIGEKESEIKKQLSIKDKTAEADISPEDLKRGMTVYVRSLRMDGEVVDVLPKDNKVQVQAGNIKLTVNMEDIGKAMATPKKIKPKAVTISKSDRHAMSSKLDLRGKNGEESLFLVEKTLGDAMLSGVHRLVIVHGKGTGKLRQIIHAYLKDNPLVVDFYLAASNEGGSGATIVEL